MIYMVITFKDYDNALHVIAPKCCHIVAMGMPLLQLPNSVITSVFDKVE